MYTARTTIRSGHTWHCKIRLLPRLKTEDGFPLLSTKRGTNKRMPLADAKDKTQYSPIKVSLFCSVPITIDDDICPIRLSHGVIAAKNSCQVTNWNSLRQPFVLWFWVSNWNSLRKDSVLEKNQKWFCRAKVTQDTNRFNHSEPKI